MRAGVTCLGQFAWAAGVDEAELDVFRPETFAAAVDGISGLLLLRPPTVSRVGPTLNALTDAAVAAGVENVVFSSVAGADTLPWVRSRYFTPAFETSSAPARGSLLACPPHIHDL